MAELMLVTTRSSAPGGGRDLLSRLHRACLEDLFGETMPVEELVPQSLGRRSLTAALAGRVDGLSREAEERIVARARREGVKRVFLNGSNLGRLACAIKERLPEVQVLTFFHNVEARFFLGALRQKPGLHALGVLVANYRAERMAVRCSDRLIALSGRDSEGLKRLYGRAATDILPMAMQDMRDSKAAADEGPEGGYALFVGGAFYANQAGIKWYAREVAPRVDLPVKVVGRGLEALRGELEKDGKVEVVGGVDSLGPWYRRAKIVIAPVFDGSGMKTKVAEALMYGKKIVGTGEAFSGYEEVAGEAGWVCDSADQFVAAIRRVETMDLPAFDPALRALYERNYSYEAALAGLSRIIRK